MSGVMRARPMAMKSVPIFGPMRRMYSSKSSISIIMGRQAMLWSNSGAMRRISPVALLTKKP